MGQNFSWLEQVGHEIWTTMSRKSQKCSSKNVRWNRMRRILHADKRPKQNHKEENLSALYQEQSYWEKNLDRCWTRGIFILRLWSIEEIDVSSSSWKSTSRKWWSNWILENQRQSSETFPALSSLVWRQVGEKAWQEEETRKDTSTVLILQEQSCISELLKVIQDAILLILLYSTMLLFRATSSSTLIMSDVQSIYIPSSIRGMIPRGQNLSKRQTVFFLPVDPMDKQHRDLDTIDLNAPRHAQYMHKAWKTIRTQYIGSTSILLWGEDESSIRPDRTLSFFTKHFQLTVFRKLLGWKLEKSHTRKYTCHLGLHQRSPWNTTGKRELGSEHASTTRRTSCATIQKFPIEPNQFQTQVVIERGNPLLEPIERGNPLLETNTRTVSDGRNTSRSQEIDTRSFHEEAVKTDTTGQPVVWNKHRKRARLLPNTFLSWKHKLQRWRRNNSWSNGATRFKPWQFKSWANNAERGEHGLPNSRVTTFCCEACSELLRSRIG